MWRPGATTSFADFGDPLARDDYTLCVFGGDDRSAVLLRAVARAGGMCAGRPCWAASGDKGFRYHDALAPTGLVGLRLTAGGDGKAKIKLLGKGAQLDPPALPVATPAHRPAPGRGRRLLGDVLPLGEREPGLAPSPRSRRSAGKLTPHFIDLRFIQTRAGIATLKANDSRLENSFM